MRSKSRTGSYLTLVSFSTCTPRWTQHGWPDTIPYNIHNVVRYHPTWRYTKLLSLGIPYVPYAPLLIKCLFVQTQPIWALIDTGGGYHLWASNFKLDHSFSFPSSILPFHLIAPPGLQLCQPFDQLAKPHRTSIDSKAPIMSGFQPLDFHW
jgi:hypothetical protein